ncbi:MAG TPA: type II toxin-antitoxin system VapB family antitoxin [Mycobacterium sp.]|uniref:type II toxin-antitoxin system VapB family antitoxin n=1 Tax=Mycobacterium sp. TaxID=1785 RepID=UPI002D3EE5CA|nr:type II toxin-antitoxin system VapB family antitoxin [Mycobacterium sp.]HZU50104.1 type II toxin-antitoxin system VapB family antitoxin [Mycobacterium sp.]
MALRKYEIQIDEDLLNEAIRRYHVHGPREAVHLALRTLVRGTDEEDLSLEEEDPFGLGALHPQRSGDN